MVGYYRLKELGFRLAQGGHVIPADEFDAIEEAARLMRDAEERSAGIIADAKIVYEQEKLRGYEDGLENARLEAIKRLIDEHRILDRALQEVAQDLSILVSSCVRKLIDGFADTARVESIVRIALGKMRREKRVEMRVSPALCPFLRSSVDALRNDFPEIELIDVIEDEALASDQVIVETSLGRVDGNLGQRLEELDLVIRRAYLVNAGAGSGPADQREASNE